MITNTNSTQSRTTATNNFSISKSLKNVNNFINKKINSIERKCIQIKNSHPKTLNIIKKITLLTFAIFALFSNPVITTVGLAIGVIFANELNPLFNRISTSACNTFHNSNWMIKALMIATGAGIILFAPSYLVTGGIGLKAGTEARFLFQNRV